VINTGTDMPARRSDAVATSAFQAARVFTLAALVTVAASGAWGQTNLPDAACCTGEASAPAATPDSPAVAEAVRAEKIRAACVQGRRCVCGRILKVLPAGLVVESGYTSLLRTNLHGAWLLPGTVTASRDANLVEGQRPDSVCAGLVFLTDLPRLRGARLKPYDYVVLHAYPAGEYTYDSAGSIRRTVRRFAGGLETAIKLNLQSGENSSSGTVAATGQTR
jgi:hypothetical protein